MSKAIIYCDGSCNGNPGYAGYGVYGYIYKDTEKSKNTKHPIHANVFFTTEGIKNEKSATCLEVLNIIEHIGSIDNHKSTNNAAELKAVMLALVMITEFNESNKELTDLRIITDSKYIVTAYADHLTKWSTNGWKKSDNKEIVHKEEWKHIDLMIGVLKQNNITVVIDWVKGHSGDFGNEMADLYSKVGSNSARVQLADPDYEMFETIMSKVITYAEYKESLVYTKDFTLHFKELYFSSDKVNDTNYCFLTNSDKVNVNIGKKSTESIFAVNIGFMPSFINDIKNFYRDNRSEYINTCCMKLSRLDDKNKLRLFKYVDLRYLLIKTTDGYTLAGDSTPFVYDLVNDFPLISNINTTFNNIKNMYDKISSSDVSLTFDYFMKDITEVFVKDSKITFSNRDNVLDLSYLLEGSNIVLKQKLIVNVGYDLPNYLAMKQLESKILNVYLILERNENTNLSTCFFKIVTSDREIYVTNINNKFLTS